MDAKNISSVEYALTIPIYQRQYSWGKEQIIKLIDDIHNAYASSGNSKYYLGSISLTTSSTENKYYILDGQQRVTTLFLLCAVLNKNYPNNKVNKLFDRFLKHKGNPRLNFVTRDNNKAFFKNLLGLASMTENDSASPKLIEAVDIIKNRLEEIALKNDIDTFSDYLANNVMLFWVPFQEKIESEGKKQSLFKYYNAINTNGKQLEKHEVLKAKLLCLIKNDDKSYNRCVNLWNSSFDPYKLSVKQPVSKRKDELNNDPYDSKEETLSSLLTKEHEELDESTKSTTSEDLVFYLLKSWELICFTYACIPNSDSKYPDFNPNLTVNDIADGMEKEKAIKFIKTLQKVRSLLERYFIQGKNQDRSSDILSQKFDVELKKDEADSASDDKEDVEDSAEKFSRADVILLQQALYSNLLKHQWIVPALRTFLEEDNKITSWDSFYKELEKTEIARCKGYLLKEGANGYVYPSYGENHCAYLLNMIDFLLAYKQKGSAKMVFTERNSVEHIIPRNNKNDDFSNLALLTSTRNSSYSNNNFLEKKIIFDDYRKYYGTFESLRLKDIYENKEEHMEQVSNYHKKLLETWLGEEGIKGISSIQLEICK